MTKAANALSKRKTPEEMADWTFSVFSEAYALDMLVQGYKERGSVDWDKIRWSGLTQPQAYRMIKSPNYTYFVVAVGVDRVKIGRASNVNSRLSAMQTGSAHDLVCAAAIRSSVDAEPALHWHLRNHHWRGEWFHMEGEVLNVLEAAQDHGARGLYEHFRECYGEAA